MNPVSKTDRIRNLYDRINYERHSKIAPGDFKLSNMLKLAERIGNVHLDCPVIHVAGTKGKGSVSSLIGSILTKAGLRTGVYSSPHLESIHQRIVVNGKEISEEDLQGVLLFLEPHIAEMDSQSDESNSKRLTFFEVITAAAFKHFSSLKVDAIVLEVGMGGRLDSTNICKPNLCVITNISLDHTKQLGSTVEEIAGEKAGIIKPGVPVVCGENKPGPRGVISDIANQKRSKLLQLSSDFHFSDSTSREKFDFEMEFDGVRFELKEVICGMAGEHQKQNAAIALASCHVLRHQYGWTINDEHMLAGVADAKLPGRCEIVSKHPQVILDMAHNEASTVALAETLESKNLNFMEASRKFLIFAASKEKDVEAMLRPLIPLFDFIVVTRYIDNPRGRPAKEVFGIAQNLIDSDPSDQELLIFDNPIEAFQFVRENAENFDAICVTGSVFLVAELRPLFVKKPY